MGKTLNLTDEEAQLVENECLAVVEAPGAPEEDDYERTAKRVLAKLGHHSYVDSKEDST